MGISMLQIDSELIIDESPYHLTDPDANDAMEYLAMQFPDEYP